MAKAASTGGALKQALEGAGLGLPIFRDRAPKDQPYPYITVREELDLGLVSRASAAAELAQVDLWQYLRWPAGVEAPKVAGRVAEDSALVRRLQAFLRGAQLPAAPTMAYRVTLEGSVRLPEPDNNLVHHALTVRVHRDLEE